MTEGYYGIETISPADPKADTRVTWVLFADGWKWEEPGRCDLQGLVYKMRKTKIERKDAFWMHWTFGRKGEY